MACTPATTHEGGLTSLTMDKLLHHVGPHAIRHAGEHIFKSLNKPAPPTSSQSNEDFEKWKANLHATAHTDPKGWLANQRGWDMFICLVGYLKSSRTYTDQWWLVSIDSETATITAREVNREMTGAQREEMDEWLRQHTHYATHCCTVSEARDLYCQRRNEAAAIQLAQVIAYISIQLQATAFTMENVEGKEKARYVLRQYTRPGSGRSALGDWVDQAQNPNAVTVYTLGREVDHIKPEIEFVGWSMTNAECSS